MAEVKFHLSFLLLTAIILPPLQKFHMDNAKFEAQLTHNEKQLALIQKPWEEKEWREQVACETKELAECKVKEWAKQEAWEKQKQNVEAQMKST